MVVCRRLSLRRLAGVALTASVVATVSACGASAPSPSTTSTTEATDVAYTPPASGCGALATRAPKDPDGVLASLPKEQQDALNLWPEIRKSAWADWKPEHAPPYTVAIVSGGAVNDFQERLVEGLRTELKASPLIKDVLYYTVGKNPDIPLQLQLYNQALQKQPDLIIAEPIQPEAFVDAETKAGKMGIPTINFVGDVQSPYSLDVDNNTRQASARMMSWLLRSNGGKGNVLFVHGYPGTSADTGAFDGVKEMIKSCPGSKLGGEVIGAYLNGPAKSETLKYLATHPTPPDIVAQAGGMGTGTIGAFTSSGRKVPLFADAGSVQGSLNYWNNHKDEVRAIGFGQPAKWTATAIVSLALRTLQGQGPKINTFVPPTPLITADNLDEWVDPSKGEKSEDAADGPRDAFLSEAYLDGLMTDPKAGQ